MDSDSGNRLRRILPFLIWGAAVFTSLIMLNAISTLSNLAAPSADVSLEDLSRGNLLPMFLGPTFWNAFPQFPMNWEAYLCSWSSVYVVMQIVGVAIWVWRKPKQVKADTYSLLAVVVWLSGFVPLVVGRVYLGVVPSDPVVVGAWAAFMLTTPLYSSLVASILMFLGATREFYNRMQLENQVSHMLP